MPGYGRSVTAVSDGHKQARLENVSVLVVDVMPFHPFPKARSMQLLSTLRPKHRHPAYLGYLGPQAFGAASGQHAIPSSTGPGSSGLWEPLRSSNIEDLRLEVEQAMINSTKS